MPTVAAFILALAVGALCLVHGLGFMAGFNTTPLPALTAAAGRALGPQLVPEKTPQVVSRGTAQAPQGATDTALHGPHEAERTGASGRVFVVVVDGLRADFAPRLALETPSGVPMAACQLSALMPSFSRPAYVALSTGVPPWASGVQTNDHEGAVALPSIWEVARQAGVPTRLVSDGTDWWTSLFPTAFDAVDIVPKRDFDAWWNAWSLPARGSPALVLVHIVAADDAAHDFGTGDAYVAEIARAGEKIQRLIDDLDPTRDTLLVTADHGHIDRGGHGGPEPEVMAIPLIVYGAGVIANPGRSGAGGRDGEHAWCGSLIDVPAAIASRLDVAPPAASMGGLLPVLVPVSAGFTAKLATQSIAVHDALATMGLDAMAHLRARPASLRGLGLGLGLWFVACLVGAHLFVVGRKRRSVASALLPVLVFVAAYAVLEPTLSLSAVWLRNPWTLRMGALAGIAALVASMAVFRRHAPAEALLLVAIGATLPVLLAVFAHGSFAAGPTLGDPHAAFAVIVADLFATAATGVALVMALIAMARERRRGRARVWTD